MKVRKFIIAVVVVFLFYNVIIVNADTGNTTHHISDISQLVGKNATVWQNVKNNDIIDISTLESTELGYIYVPESISAITIKGSTEKTYSKFHLNCKAFINVTLENVNASSSTGTSSFLFPSNVQCVINVIGTNYFTAANNSKCIIGNVKICGEGDLSLKSGKTIDSTNLAHCIYGDVIFDNSGTINVISGDGNDGTSTAIAGLSSGDAIYGNVECKNTGIINITSGYGGDGYYNSSTSSRGQGGNSGNVITGNLICTEKVNVVLKSGKSGTGYVSGLAGNGVNGNVIVMDNAIVSIEGGAGGVSSYNKGGYGGVGINGTLKLYGNSNVTSIGGAGSAGNNGTKSHPSFYGDGGDGGSAVLGDVYLVGTSILNVKGGDGGNGGSMYTTSTPTSGTSNGGDGAPAIVGKISVGKNCELIATGGSGKNGGLAKISNGGDAGSAIIGNLDLGENIKLIAKHGEFGSRYSTSTSGVSGAKGYDAVVNSQPVLCGGYIDAIFYDETKKVVTPIDQSGNALYLTKIVPQLGNAFLIDKELKIISENIDYTTYTDENGYIYCYLPSNQNLVLNYGMYDAALSYVWEDNSTSMYITLERNTNNDDKPIELTVKPNVVNGNVVFFVKANELITTEMLHIALFGETNQMIDYIIVPTIEPFTYTNVVFKDDKSIKYGKVFLWEGMQSLTPISGAIRVEIR